MTELKPYPEYKDSGVESLGKIPSHWSKGAIGRFARFRNGADYSAVEVAEGGYPVYGSGGEFRRASSFLFDGESVLFGRKGTIDRPLLVSGRFWTVDTMFFTEINRSCLVPRFVYYWATQLPYAYWVTSTALPSMTQNDLSSAIIPVLDIEEQAAIANFLDQEVAEIDAFIGGQEDLVALLVERRAASVSEAVTKGLDPTVPMKESGIEWLGHTPAKWDVARASRFYAITLGKMLDGGKEIPAGATILPYVRAANIQTSGLDLTSVNTMAFTPFEARSLSIEAGDLLVVEGGASVGINNFIEADMPGWSFQKTVNRVRTKGSASSKFFGYVLDALRGSGVIEMLANKSAMPHLTAEKLNELTICVPPAIEQAEIVAYLDHSSAEIDSAIADAREAIVLSKERRAALISEAVTGKIDVRALVGGTA